MSRIKTVCDETWQAFRTTSDVKSRERLHAVLLSNDGRTRSEIAEILFRNVDEITPWLRTYQSKGLEALLEFDKKPIETHTEELDSSENAVPVATSASDLSDEEQSLIRQCLRSSPRFYGRRTRVWSTKTLADVLQQNMGRDISHDEIRGFLQNSGLAKLQSKEQFLEKLKAPTRRFDKLAVEAAAQTEAKEAPLSEPEEAKQETAEAPIEASVEAATPPEVEAPIAVDQAPSSSIEVSAVDDNFVHKATTETAAYVAEHLEAELSPLEALASLSESDDAVSTQLPAKH